MQLVSSSASELVAGERKAKCVYGHTRMLTRSLLHVCSAVAQHGPTTGAKRHDLGERRNSNYHTCAQRGSGIHPYDGHLARDEETDMHALTMLLGDA